VRTLNLALPAVALFVLIACRDDKKHVFQAPAPAAAVVPPQVIAVPGAPEAPTGTFADARITWIADADNGGPVELMNITRPISVMTVTARGPSRPASESARIELLMRGASDATQVLALPAPASSVVAHAFTIPAGDAGAGLRPGRYTLQVRIIGGDGHVLATSVPLHIELR
jgi:hypothetical protein